MSTPQGWTRAPRSDHERQEAIGGIRRQVFERIHALVADRLIVAHPDDWRRALSFSGTGSSDRRAREMRTIYDAAAPSISSVMDPEDRKFLDEVIRIVGDVITTAGGTLEGAEPEGLSDRGEGPCLKIPDIPGPVPKDWRSFYPSKDAAQ